MDTFFNSNIFVGLSTIFVGGFAIILYIAQRSQAKRDAAKIILQEIRRAEDIIARYKEYGNFQFTKKIIANNSWGKNIHYFVGVLSADELDKISNLYSTGEFLDAVISKIFEWRFDDASRAYYGEKPKKKMSIPIPPLPSITPLSPAGSQSGAQATSGQQVLEIEIPDGPPFWDPLLKEVVFKYEPIYHSTISEKLKKISEKNG
jgi:hypothetical protein